LTAATSIPDLPAATYGFAPAEGMQDTGYLIYACIDARSSEQQYHRVCHT